MKDDEAQLAALLHRGKKLEAIERLRQRTGLGLAEAKAEIERIEMRATAVWAPSSRSEAPPAAGGIDADIRLLAQQGQRIEAIKKLRERKGLGLKEAKDALDAEVPPPPSSSKKWIWMALLLGAGLALASAWFAGKL